MQYIILDMEWNQPWPGSYSAKKALPSPLRGEIVQIGAVRMTQDQQVADEFQILIRPKYFKKMNRKVASLTGIRDSVLREKGVSFPEAAAKFQTWCGEACVFLTWGFDDITVLRENLAVFGLADGWTARWYNAQLIFNAQTDGSGAQKALSTAMQMMDIECMVVHDSYLGHSWDLVKLDGQWYHTDVYSDAPGGNFSHFNINDTEMMNMQEWNTDFFPAAEGYKYNYAYMNRVGCDDIYTVPGQLRAAIDAQKGVVSFDFGKEVSDDTYSILETIMKQVENAVTSGSDKGVGITWSWLQAGDDNVFCVYLNYEKETEDPDSNVDIDAETQQKIDEAVNKAFGNIGSDDVIIGGVSEKTVIS